ncbi:hypothetical protein [Aromatoleum diolicum]|uniref:Transmembrane protein n=1 Tax=Aromatoleum diolicum TaxID=75796 RepID=A0ABX1QC03_9RHOO|nr:hypothetical protein [Aromatoleum diolicum]NMG75050.1 hypothetical protein [Aromatoleum diolicum]
MIPAGQSLSYDSAPAFSTPLRFFLTAPAFGIATGATLLAVPELLDSRWTPGALAVTHLIAVGFMLSVMLGALLQILPVVAGAVIPLSGAVSTVVHLALTIGAICLAWGLGSGAHGYLVPATVLLGGALALFLIAAAVGLRRAPIAQATPRDLRLALLGFGIAVTLGIALALVLARDVTLPLLIVLKLHIGWALLGGAGVLLAATSWVVVPMFQITPNYPVALTRFWAMGTGSVLVLWSAAVLGELVSAEFALAIVLTGSCVAFAVSTLRLQRQSRRSVPDVTMRAFQLGMASFIAGLACVLVAHQSDQAVWPVLAGILVLHGGFVSVTVGMLYKIVPFLAWLHLTQEKGKAPNMKKLQPDTPVRRQLMAHAVALVMLVLAAVGGHAVLVRAAGVVLVIEFGWLLANLLKVIAAYRNARAAS